MGDGRIGSLKVDEDGAQRAGLGDEGDDAHPGCAKRAEQRKDFVGAGEQLRPGVTGGASQGDCAGGGFGVAAAGRGALAIAITAWRNRRIGGRHAAVAMAMEPRRRYERGQPLEQFERVKRTAATPPPSLA